LPDLESLTTNHVEREFLTVRQELKRFERKGLGYSKSLEMPQAGGRAPFRRLQFRSPTPHAWNDASRSRRIGRKALELRTGRRNDCRLHAAKRGREETKLRETPMLITVLAAEALSGLLSLRASVTLASILTVTMLPWALAMLRRSPFLSAMTLAMLGMLWRGEAWKTVCL